ncbi:hypothetical protein EDC04DRAFT_1493147 [Pisolithus marmoratus]|nr:hypothetical protein EDC04DRAFT_1493147 [Pisolithus marmoratus]
MSGTNSPSRVQPSPSNPQRDQEPQPRGFAFDKLSTSCPYNTTPQWASHLNGSEPVSGPANAFKRPQQSLSENLLSGNSGPFSTSSTSAFGVLGQNTTKPEMTTAALGGPATGFGAFATTFGGSASTFGSTTRPPTAGHGFFGSTTNTGGTCGSGGKLDGPNMRAFEGKPVTDQGGTVAPAPIGTASPPYSIYAEKDPLSTAELQYFTISAMPAYRGTSIEELRMQD